MKILIAPTEDFVKEQVSALTADAAAGSSVTLSLEGNTGFANQDYIVIGYEGVEHSELQQINQVVTAGTNVRVATLARDHKAGEPVFKYRFNQRRFYGATSADGSYTELTDDGSPVNISVDDPQGTMLEYSDTDYTYFKATYYNSTTDEETDIADADAVLGDETTRYASIYAIKKHAGMQNNPYYSDARFEEKRKQAENEINSVLYTRYVLPLSEVPGLIRRICELLAAGYIDYEEFGKDGEGVKWLGEARSLLSAIANGRQRLIGADGTLLPINERVDVLDGYPNTSEDVGEPGGPKFGMDQRF